jgi:hypothetical protein
VGSSPAESASSALCGPPPGSRLRPHYTIPNAAHPHQNNNHNILLFNHPSDGLSHWTVLDAKAFGCHMASLCSAALTPPSPLTSVHLTHPTPYPTTSAQPPYSRLLQPPAPPPLGEPSFSGPAGALLFSCGLPRGRGILTASRCGLLLGNLGRGGGSG